MIPRALLFLAMALCAAPLHAGRFMATPYAATMPRGKVSLWQFGLFEARSSDEWRTLNRVDLGLRDDVELGVFVIDPNNGPVDTWINLQFRAVKEEGFRPTVSVGVWDIFRDGRMFSQDKVGPSPFVSLGRKFETGGRFLKAGVSYGSNRLHGAFGGVELGLSGKGGLQVEYLPKNSRLPRADAWDVGFYYWLQQDWRARVSWVGGNPMLDLFFTYRL